MEEQWHPQMRTLDLRGYGVSHQPIEQLRIAAVVASRRPLQESVSLHNR